MRRKASVSGGSGVGPPAGMGKDRVSRGAAAATPEAGLWKEGVASTAFLAAPAAAVREFPERPERVGSSKYLIAPRRRGRALMGLRFMCSPGSDVAAELWLGAGRAVPREGGGRPGGKRAAPREFLTGGGRRQGPGDDEPAGLAGRQDGGRTTCQGAAGARVGMVTTRKFSPDDRLPVRKKCPDFARVGRARALGCQVARHPRLPTAATCQVRTGRTLEMARPDRGPAPGPSSGRRPDRISPPGPASGGQPAGRAFTRSTPRRGPRTP